MDFRDEIKDYTIDDLKLIITDQQNLYSAEELEQLQVLLKEKLKIRQEQRQAKVLERLPKIILCPKCDGPNPFLHDKCDFCGAKLDKERYYCEAEIEPSEEAELMGEEETTSRENSYTFHNVISFLIPLIGFIVGAIMLANDNEEKASAGKWCIIWGIIGMVVSTILAGVLIGAGLW